MSLIQQLVANAQAVISAADRAIHFLFRCKFTFFMLLST